MFDASQSFNFLPLPTDVHFGAGSVERLAALIEARGLSRVLIVTDPGVKAAGILARVLQVLEPSGAALHVFDGVTPDSGSTLIREGARVARDHAADAVVAVGGGSSLDTAKAIAALVTNGGDPLDYLGLHRLPKPPVPIIAIPTTAGTGSEVSLWSVFTNDDTRDKVAIGSVWLYPAVAICDPDLTLDLPPALTAATGMDALGHAVECYTNTACQPISAALALDAIRLIGRFLRPAVFNGHRREARYGMLLASTMAGMAMNPTRLGLAHALAMPLGSRHLKIAHGLAVAVTLPHVIAFNAMAAPERFAQVTSALGLATAGLSVHDAAALAADAVQRLGRDIGIPAGLGECGLKATDIPAVVSEAMKSGNVAVNPRRTTQAQLEAILHAAL